MKKLLRRIKRIVRRGWNNPDGPLAILADAWAFIVNPAADQLVDPRLHPGRRGGMSLREAQLRGLVLVPIRRR